LTSAAALLDSNVIIAILAEAHEHHAASLALITAGEAAAYTISAHSYAETYNTLTRRGDRAPFRFSAAEAWAALESLRAVTRLVGLTPSQTFDVVRAFANAGRVGPRLYDALIGEAAIAHDIPCIVTWNTRHMRALFPSVDVQAPNRFLARLESGSS
jgi:predicted nucleic acid-binding protein